MKRRTMASRCRFRCRFRCLCCQYCVVCSVYCVCMCSMPMYWTTHERFSFVKTFRNAFFRWFLFSFFFFSPIYFHTLCALLGSDEDRLLKKIELLKRSFYSSLEKRPNHFEKHKCVCIWIFTLVCWWYCVFMRSRTVFHSFEFIDSTIYIWETICDHWSLAQWLIRI